MTSLVLTIMTLLLVTTVCHYCTPRQFWCKSTSNFDFRTTHRLQILHKPGIGQLGQRDPEQGEAAMEGAVRVGPARPLDVP